MLTLKLLTLNTPTLPMRRNAIPLFVSFVPGSPFGARIPSIDPVAVSTSASASMVSATTDGVARSAGVTGAFGCITVQWAPPTVEHSSAHVSVASPQVASVVPSTHDFVPGAQPSGPTPPPSGVCVPASFSVGPPSSSGGGSVAPPPTQAVPNKAKRKLRAILRIVLDDIGGSRSCRPVRAHVASGGRRI
ncbi:MAG: hypothetical protein KF819_40865 [Labilithrix sp.]|nr:hypothetical protein [Labilithrix sp.]